MSSPNAKVTAVCSSSSHGFSKKVGNAIEIVAGHGVKDDAHAGSKVQHLSRVKADPSQPNLRQVHLIHAELFAEVAAEGFDIHPGDLGENITTCGIELLKLGRGTLLQIGDNAVLEVTGLRNPCHQIDAFAPGLLKLVAVKTPNGIIRKAGIMTIVREGGIVRADDAITVTPPSGAHIPLERV